ncbi:MAG: hypothetical protein A2934_05500 [Candidatus Sungbacteria bacterium RIFCSPLOWO2_01_FULL_47_10]|uniref:Uncharacterized protein n=1 Tax=Candidatus Sungbacteria bacterium RIFCSPLOWO2_01_FULL_47_10 TaxID=1802276 RepID=A0A1G2L1H1_9BACT|nr:MAG: hypothetical protein A2934_05500 [Candidatus Sungbacteria bacterium RIFCSPLOWO2_01_FULL_47_10]
MDHGQSSSHEQNAPHSLNILTLIRGFVEYAEAHGKKTFPVIPSRPWHEFLYRLKKEKSNEFPELECIGRFDWDGPYPKNPELEELWVAFLLICWNLDGYAVMQDWLKQHANYLSFSRSYPELAAICLAIAEDMKFFG